MSLAIKAVVKPSSMATINSCLISLPSLNITTSSSYPHVSMLSKPPFKLNLSCSYSSCPLLFLKKNRTHFRTVVSVLAAQQEEENNTVVLEEENFKWENQESSENEQVEDEGAVEESFDEDAKVFVGNLSYDVDSEQLAHLFEQAGTVEIAEVIYNRETDQSRGFGFVTMSTEEDANRAVEMFNHFDLNGRLLTVNKASPRGSQPERPPRVFEPSYRIYVGNLPWNVDDARLEQVFNEHGKVINAKVVYDRETGRSRGFGFVTMSSESELNDAISNLDGQTMDGRTIRVSVAERRTRRM